MQKRQRPSSADGNEDQKQQLAVGVGSSGASGETVKMKQAKCPHHRRRSDCKQCGGASICEHNRRRSVCKQCGGANICEHNRIRSVCKRCVFKETRGATRCAGDPEKERMRR
jgi:hypothetical protein